jgi:polysaccharide chain length determinant protein (PEP-CTERM system associated)
MPIDAMPLPELLTLLVKEGKRRILVLTAIFGVVAIGVLVVGLLTPKRWEASTLIVADARDIIKPLLEGRAVPTTIADQTPIVSQAMVSHRILRELATFGGWPVAKMTPVEEDRLFKDVKSRIKIETQREDTIRISYSDTHPQRAYRLTNKMAEIFIRESMALKEKQSHDAFDFISRRVEEYAQKMAEAHENLLAHYRGAEGPRAGAVARVATAAAADAEGEPRRSRIPPTELAALRAEEVKLTAQLSHKPAVPSAPVESRQAEEQVRTHVMQLQAELDRLRVTYTEQHPDVLRVQRELKDAKAELTRAEQARADHDKAVAATTTVDDEKTRATEARLEDVQQKIAAATGARPRSIGPRAVAAADSSTDLEMRGVGQDTALSELARRYEATRDVYQDLLKRRENARVSMDLDSERRGLTLRVQEAADLPVTASSVRLLYVALAGLALAVVAPIGLLFALIRLDPRIRSAQQIERLVRLPVLVTIPSGATAQDTSRSRTRWVLAASIAVGVFVIYAATLVMKMQTPS